MALFQSALHPTLRAFAGIGPVATQDAGSEADGRAMGSGCPHQGAERAGISSGRLRRDVPAVRALVCRVAVAAAWAPSESNTGRGRRGAELRCVEAIWKRVSGPRAVAPPHSDGLVCGSAGTENEGRRLSCQCGERRKSDYGGGLAAEAPGGGTAGGTGPKGHVRGHGRYAAAARRPAVPRRAP